MRMKFLLFDSQMQIFSRDQGKTEFLALHGKRNSTPVSAEKKAKKCTSYKNVQPLMEMYAIVLKALMARGRSLGFLNSKLNLRSSVPAERRCCRRAAKRATACSKTAAKVVLGEGRNARFFQGIHLGSLGSCVGRRFQAQPSPPPPWKRRREVWIQRVVCCTDHETAR